MKIKRKTALFRLRIFFYFVLIFKFGHFYTHRNLETDTRREHIYIADQFNLFFFFNYYYGFLLS